MRQLVLGIVGVVVGLAILASGLAGGSDSGARAIAVIFGLLLLVVGARAIMKHRREASN
jgi:hypothetical protein